MRFQLLPPDLIRGKDQVSPLLLALVALLSFTLTVWWFAPAGDPANRGRLAGKSYVYESLSASNGVVLHAITTSPRNISLKAIDKNVTETRDNGINGGFFWEGYLLSIAVVNDKPVRDTAGVYGSGWFNTDRARGTLVWDDAAGLYTVQVAASADKLQVSDRSRYWAQGGVSMGLLNEGGWKEQAIAEEFPAMEEDRLRSGMVYDSDGKLWLLVTTTPCTGPEFRDAVKEQVAVGKLLDGIFLDGDGSSQLKLGKLRIEGDRRPVFQMITLVNP